MKASKSKINKQEATNAYIKSFDKYFKCKQGEITIIGGGLAQYKTNFTLMLCLTKSLNEGVKWMLYNSSDRVDLTYQTLIELYIGKTAEVGHKNTMSVLEFNTGMDFINNHFFFVYPRDNNNTQQYLNNRFVELHKKNGVTGYVIDSFKGLIIETDNIKEDFYVNKFIADQKKFALNLMIYQIIVVNAKSVFENQNIDMFSFPGGPIIPNKADNIIITSVNKSGIKVSIDKIKHQKQVGVPGVVNINFDDLINKK